MGHKKSSFNLVKPSSKGTVKGPGYSVEYACRPSNNGLNVVDVTPIITDKIVAACTDCPYILDTAEDKARSLVPNGNPELGLKTIGSTVVEAAYACRQFMELEASQNPKAIFNHGDPDTCEQLRRQLLEP